MDIISPPRFGSRKRSWGDEQLDRPYKRVSYSRTRERPQCVALAQQVPNLPLEVNVQLEDVIMTGVNESQQQDQIQGVPIRSTFEYISAIPDMRSDAQLHSPDVVTSLSGTSTTTPVPVAPASLPNRDVKKRFAIGPRSNCQRCLSREPGHYGHWL